MFHLMCVHIIFSMVSVAEWPPFEKLLLTQLTICSLCILTICKIISSPELKAHKVILWYTSRAGICPSVSVCVCLCDHTFKHEYLGNQWADRNQIITEASLGWGKGCTKFRDRHRFQYHCQIMAPKWVFSYCSYVNNIITQFHL